MALITCAPVSCMSQPTTGFASATPPVVATSVGGATVTSTPVPSCAELIADTLDPRDRAAQLLIVGSALADPVGSSRGVLAAVAPGGVFLTGRSHMGVQATAARTDQLQRWTAGPAGLLVAVDQEGGQVQTLSGQGFSQIPPATEQGTWQRTDLVSAAARWGGELRAAGVSLDLAPVSDVLQPALGSRDLSVGVNQRTYGTAPDSVGSHVLAFIAGLTTAGVGASVKHFPGLGQVAGNTDNSPVVRDTTTGPDSPALGPFREAIGHGVPVVMVSSAIYTRIDRQEPAVFSPTVITRLLRGRLGFTGVVISDDLGRAAAVSSVSPSGRATRFVAAGGDLVLTADPATAQPMLDGLVARMNVDAGFATQVRVAAGRVLALKETLGLLHC